MTYILYAAKGTASMAVRWMLLELDANFRVEVVDLTAGE